MGKGKMQKVAETIVARKETVDPSENCHGEHKGRRTY